MSKLHQSEKCSLVVSAEKRMSWPHRFHRLIISLKTARTLRRLSGADASATRRRPPFLSAAGTRWTVVLTWAHFHSPSAIADILHIFYVQLNKKQLVAEWHNYQTKPSRIVCGQWHTKRRFLLSFIAEIFVVISQTETISNPKKTSGLDEYCPIPLTSPGARQQQTAE